MYQQTRNTIQPTRRSIQASNLPLTDEEIYSVAPSVYQSTAHADRSKNYSYLSTSKVLASLREEGFFPFYAMQSGSRTEDKRTHTKHMLRFRQVNQMQEVSIGADINEIILINSHDGSSSYQLTAGVYRLVCSNGMVAGNSFSSIRIPHKGVTAGDVIEGVYSVVNDFTTIQDTKESMKSIILTPEERTLFGQTALALRYNPNEAQPSAKQIVNPKRNADAEPDLWSTLNVVQEHLLNGGQIKTVNPDPTRRSNSRAVGNIPDNLRLNRSLWDLAEGMKQLKLGITMDIAGTVNWEGLL